MIKPGKHIDYYEKFCKKCIYEAVDEHDSPCVMCIGQFFRDRTFIHFKKAKEQEDGKSRSNLSVS